MRIVVIGLLLAALALAAGMSAVGAPARTWVPAIELRGETSEPTTTRPRRGAGAGATPVQSPAPAPVGGDDVDQDEGSGHGDD